MWSLDGDQHGNLTTSLTASLITHEPLQSGCRTQFVLTWDQFTEFIEEMTTSCL